MIAVQHDNHILNRIHQLISLFCSVYYYLEDGTEILDGVAGLWCVNAGHKQVLLAVDIKMTVFFTFLTLY